MRIPYFTFHRKPNTTLLNAAKKQITGHHENFYRYLALSPDGSLLVYAALEGKYLGLWIMPAEGGKSIPLSITKTAHNECTIWSPDGKSIASTQTNHGLPKNIKLLFNGFSENLNFALAKSTPN